MAYGAAADRAQNAVMTGVMAGDAADDCALEAALSLGGRRTNGQRRERSEHRCGDYWEFHARVPLSWVAKSSGDLGSASPLGKAQRKHFTWQQPRSRGNHCNSADARL
jgi:hypothetical protein